MKRIDCLNELAALVNDSLAVVALAGTTDEWNHVRPSSANFFNVAMGSNLPLAMGLAFALPHRRVVLLDTDGCQLMTLGALCTLANHPPANLRVFVFDNESYARTGAQPTATAGRSSLAALARAAGLENVREATSLPAFREAAHQAMDADELTYVVAKVEPIVGTYMGLGFDHVESKYRFVHHIEETEGRRILSAR